MNQNTELDYEAALRASMWDRTIAPQGLSIVQQHIAADRNRRFLYVLFLGMFILLAMSMCCSCNHRPATKSDPLVAIHQQARIPDRDVAAQYDASVFITITCDVEGIDDLPFGSGVIVSPTQLLTANHVADVQSFADAKNLTGCVLYGKLNDGTRYQLHLERSWPGEDVARLAVTLGETFSIAPALTTGPVPPAGGEICLAPAYPARMRRCGDVQRPFGKPSAGGDVVHTAITEHGNSGSGAYDRAGRLVAIVTHLWNCSNGQICGGRVSTFRPEFLQ